MKNILFISILGLASISNAANYVCAVGAQKNEPGSYELVSSKTVQLELGQLEVLLTQGNLVYSVMAANSFDKETKVVRDQEILLYASDKTKMNSSGMLLMTSTKLGQKIQLIDESNNVAISCIPL